ncbi:hypothetical protein [Pararhizobium sp.]|uniref:hypothetical protein n=1 Tax=Pararhizobium sp. TaxID=1977563 RepID=UPI002719624C|nr:hypothetical protein [Pararhizobium sp.]MDO9415584.1 hypothetical protein [Pararhizobium sp.]
MQNIALNTVKVKISNGQQRLVVSPRSGAGAIDHDWEGAKGEFYLLARRKYRDTAGQVPKPRPAG